MKYFVSYTTDTGPVWFECGDGELESVITAAGHDERRTGWIQVRVVGTAYPAPQPKTPYSQLRFDVV